MSDNKLPRNDRELEENNSWNKLSKWETLVEDRIRSIIGDGNMSWHPRAGQPLDLSEDDHVPEDQRIAYKLMRDHDAVPAWVDLGSMLRDKQEKLLRRLYQYARDYTRRRREARLKGSFVLEQHADDRWKQALQRWHTDVGSYNRDLLNFNLQVPAQVGQRVPMDADAEIQKALDAAQDAL